MGHARALLPLDKAHQITCGHEIVARKLSVREAEKLATRTAADSATQSGAAVRSKADKPRDLLRIEEQLADHLTAAVEIRVKKRTKRGELGEVAIAFGSLDELNGLLDKLGLRSDA
jgi:ParB family chromosome partitioning protein